MTPHSTRATGPRWLARTALGFALVVCVGMICAVPVDGAVTYDTQLGSNQLYYPVSATDLINQGQPTPPSVVTVNYLGLAGSNVAAMTDGWVGTASSNPTIAFDYNDATPGAWTTTYTLDTTVNTLGYDITSIQSFSGWTEWRSGQRYTVSYNTVSNPTFISLGTYQVDVNGGSSRITLYNPGGLLASGVKSLQFDFSKGVTEYVYREIDVFGSASVPEPGTAAMLIGLGAVGLGMVLVRRWRG